MSEKPTNKQLSTLEVQELNYKQLANELHRTGGLSRADLIKRANKHHGIPKLRHSSMAP